MGTNLGNHSETVVSNEINDLLEKTQNMAPSQLYGSLKINPIENIQVYGIRQVEDFELNISKLCLRKLLRVVCIGAVCYWTPVNGGSYEITVVCLPVKEFFPVIAD